MAKKSLPKLTARRTSEIEAILQDLWQLRPDLANKHKLTIYLSLDALVRESRGEAREASAQKDDTTFQSAVSSQPETDIGKQTHSVEANTFPHPEDDISDDAEWGDNF